MSKKFSFHFFNNYSYSYNSRVQTAESAYVHADVLCWQCYYILQRCSTYQERKWNRKLESSFMRNRETATRTDKMYSHLDRA